MPTPSHRRESLEDQIRGEVAEMIHRELKDPRIGFTTVTRVELTGDLARARVLVSVLGSVEAQEETLAGLLSATRFLRHELGRRLRLRRVPELVFVLDHGAEVGERIEELLRKLKEPPL